MKPPLRFFFQSLQNAKESDLGHKGNLFYILCGHSDEKNGGTTLPVGRVSRQRVRGEGGYNLFRFLKYEVAILKISAYYAAETDRTCLNCHFPSV